MRGGRRERREGECGGISIENDENKNDVEFRRFTFPFLQPFKIQGCNSSCQWLYALTLEL